MKKNALIAATAAALIYFGFGKANAQTYNIPTPCPACTSSVYIGTTDNNLNIESNYAGTTAGDIIFSTNSSTTGSAPAEAMRLTSSGSLLLSGTSGTTPASGSGARLMWIPSKYALRAGFVSSTQWDDANIGSHSIALGYNTKASSLGTFAAGYSSSATGSYSTGIGFEATASGNTSLALGDNVNASGSQSVALGTRVNATASNSFSIGYGGIFSTLDNNIANSLIVGFNGSPALFVSNGGSTTAVAIGTSTIPSVPASGGNVNSLQLSVSGNANISNALIVGSTSAFTASTPFPTGYSIYAQNGMLVEKVKVATKTGINWSDFVFDKTYKLRSLTEVESYIKTNHHLPEIPSTEEVNANGVDLLEMDAKLLQKIEELTLYVIEMEKKMKELEKKNQALEKKISE